MLDATTCRAAMLRRDPALDGLFFVAVRTTMIDCRPVCRARMPLWRNVRFYQSAAAAERALKMIEAGALDTGSVETPDVTAEDARGLWAP